MTRSRDVVDLLRPAEVEDLNRLRSTKRNSRSTSRKSDTQTSYLPGRTGIANHRKPVPGQGRFSGSAALTLDPYREGNDQREDAFLETH